MPRAARSRLTEVACCYHVTQRCHGRRFLFRDRERERILDERIDFAEGCWRTRSGVLRADQPLPLV
jgi:REP element-mobilizing transposase RayT